MARLSLNDDQLQNILLKDNGKDVNEQNELSGIDELLNNECENEESHSDSNNRGKINEGVKE